MGKNKSIYFSLVIVSVVLSVVLSVLVSFVLRNMISTEIDNIRKSDLRQDSDQMHVLFKTEQENFNKELLFIQNGIKWDGFDSEAEIYERISDLVSEFGFYSVNIAEKSGNVVFSAGKNSSLSMPSEKKAMSEALSGRTGSAVTLKNDEILFTAAGLFPALNDCVIVIQKELSSHEWIAELADIMKCSMTIFIEDTSVETSDLDSDGKPRVGGKMGSPFILDTVYKKRQVLEYIDRYKGNVSATVFSPIDSDDGNAMLYLGIDMKKLTETSSRITSLAIPIVIIALLLSFAIILFIIFYVIMKPLKTTSDAFERLNGNSGYSDLTVSIEVKKENEIGKMIVSVNKFIDSLRKLISDVNSAESNLESIGNALASNSQESASAISQIMSNILSVKKQITRQNETIQEVQNTLDHSSAGIDNLERHIENQSSKISESSSSIEKMVENIAEVSQSVEKLAGEYKQLIDITDAGKVRQNEMAEQINNMAEQSKHLADANAVISQIAAQTNLLAMNAAIEAAHAGESGKGFSVVADEIRKLAENSAHQSDSIKKELEAIGVVIEDVVKASELSVKEFENITEKVGSTEKLVQEIDSSMNTQHQSSQQVLVNLRDINESTSSVLETSKDMASGIENVAAAAGNLGMMAQVVEGSMDEMTTGVKEINASAQHLSEMAMTTHENIKVMNNVLSKFKIS